MPDYSVHGLNLRSAMPFPELSPGGAPVDVTLRLGGAGVRRPADVPPGSWFEVAPGDACLVWQDFGAVRVRGGIEILCEPAAELDPTYLRAMLLGPVLSVLLYQRGLLPLHACSVRMGEAAVAFAGASGEGKSTLAAVLAARGHGFLADDVTAVDLETQPPQAHPGVPLVRLSEEAAGWLGVDFEKLPLAVVGETKRLREVPVEQRQLAALPLAAVCVLESGSKVARDPLEPLERRDAFFEALRHVHRPDLLELCDGAAGHMQRCGRLVETVPFFRLRRRRGLGALAELAQQIERVFAS